MLRMSKRMAALLPYCWALWRQAMSSCAWHCSRCRTCTGTDQARPERQFIYLQVVASPVLPDTRVAVRLRNASARLVPGYRHRAWMSAINQVISSHGGASGVRVAEWSGVAWGTKSACRVGAIVRASIVNRQCLACLVTNVMIAVRPVLMHDLTVTSDPKVRARHDLRPTAEKRGVAKGATRLPRRRPESSAHPL